MFVHLLRPAARRGAVLTVRLARVGAEAGVLGRQRLEVADGERQVGDDRRREREGCGLTATERERGKGGGNFHQSFRGQEGSQKPPEPQREAAHIKDDQSLELNKQNPCERRVPLGGTVVQLFHQATGRIKVNSLISVIK